MGNARNYKHQVTIIQFLNGFNNYFSVIKSQILLMDPLPSLNKILCMIIQHERLSNTSVG